VPTALQNTARSYRTKPDHIRLPGYADARVDACDAIFRVSFAVSEGAAENKGFAYYVNYLAEEGHIPPKATTWVDHIRDKGNEANHEIKIMNREDAERLIKFSEMLLRIMYEYPAEVENPS
jgi:hypothetical protein